jgi:hypothetical protein
VIYKLTESRSEILQNTISSPQVHRKSKNSMLPISYFTLYFLIATSSLWSLVSSFSLMPTTSRGKLTNRHSKSVRTETYQDDQDILDSNKLIKVLYVVGKISKLNKVVPNFNDGRFNSIVISGRLKSVTSKPVLLSVLTFGLFADPEECGRVNTDPIASVVYKGEMSRHHLSEINLYAVETSFDFEHKQGSYSGGISTAIGRYSVEKDNSTMTIVFHSVELILHRLDGGTETMTKKLSKEITGSHNVLLQVASLTVIVGNFGSLFFLFPKKY